MKHKIISILAAIVICSSVMAQGERKLNENFTFRLAKLDTIASFSIEQRSLKGAWGNFYNSLTDAFIANGFRVVAKEKSVSKHSFRIVIDYDRETAGSRTQYSNLTGEIIDVNNNSEVIGTFSYNKRFEIEDISNAIASKLKSKKPIIVKEEEIKSAISTKSKEERLLELKNLFEKGLISKEEYENARRKLIEE